MDERIFTSVSQSDNQIRIEWLRHESRMGIIWDPIDTSSWYMVKPDGSSKSGVITEETPIGSIIRLIEEFAL